MDRERTRSVWCERARPSGCRMDGLTEHQAEVMERVLAEEEARRTHVVVYLSGALVATSRRAPSARSRRAVATRAPALSRLRVEPVEGVRRIAHGEEASLCLANDRDGHSSAPKRRSRDKPRDPDARGARAHRTK